MAREGRHARVKVLSGERSDREGHLYAPVSTQPRHFVEHVAAFAPSQWPPPSLPAASSPAPPPLGASSPAHRRCLLPSLLSAGSPPTPRRHRLSRLRLSSRQSIRPSRRAPPPTPVPTVGGPTGPDRGLHRRAAARVARGTRRSMRRSSARRCSMWFGSDSLQI